MKGDYIKINRSLLEWGWYKDKNTSRLFIHMLLKANWKDGFFLGIEIKRGSFVSSLAKLSEETNLSVREIRTSNRQASDNNRRREERKKEYIDTNVSIKQHSIQSIIDAWNQLEPYGIKMIYRINQGSKRCTSLIALLEQFGEEKVIQAVDKVKQSDFLQGKTDTRFSLNFDWFINPNNFVKVLEGKYDERHDKKPATKNNNNFERRHYDMDDLESKLLGR